MLTRYRHDIVNIAFSTRYRYDIVNIAMSTMSTRYNRVPMYMKQDRVTMLTRCRYDIVYITMLTMSTMSKKHSELDILMILYDLCSAYESYSAHENITGTTYPYTTVEPKSL